MARSMTSSRGAPGGGSSLALMGVVGITSNRVDHFLEIAPIKMRAQRRKALDKL
jgi:formiminotetrahydrofolate cyclodeaminase